jgi:hypothetical protein
VPGPSDDAGETAFIQADLREPPQTLADPVLAAALVLARPVALMLVAVLMYFPDEEDPQAMVSALVDVLAPGSYLAITHPTADFNAEAMAGAVAAAEHRGHHLGAAQPAETEAFHRPGPSRAGGGAGAGLAPTTGRRPAPQRMPLRRPRPQAVRHHEPPCHIPIWSGRDLEGGSSAWCLTWTRKVTHQVAQRTVNERRLRSRATSTSVCTRRSVCLPRVHGPATRP